MRLKVFSTISSVRLFLQFRLVNRVETDSADYGWRIDIKSTHINQTHTSESNRVHLKSWILTISCHFQKRTNWLYHLTNHPTYFVPAHIWGGYPFSWPGFIKYDYNLLINQKNEDYKTSSLRRYTYECQEQSQIIT